MKATESHPDRPALFQAATTGDIPFEEHLRACSACRTLFDRLKQLHQNQSRPFEAPSSEAIAAWSAIPLLDGHSARVTRRRGAVSFDSWAQPGAVAIRDISVGDVRRLVLNAGSVAFELVAERLQFGWECVARVYERGAIGSGYVLELGKRRLLPTAQGYYHWTARQGPRAITLLAIDQEIQFECPSWM